MTSKSLSFLKSSVVLGTLFDKERLSTQDRILSPVDRPMSSGRVQTEGPTSVNSCDIDFLIRGPKQSSFFPRRLNPSFSPVGRVEGGGTIGNHTDVVKSGLERARGGRVYFTVF